MNHDYSHCLDYDDECPDVCFRAQLVRDLTDEYWVSWSSFKGTPECAYFGVKEEISENINQALCSNCSL